MDRKMIPPTLRCAALVAGSIGPMVAAVAQEASEPTIIDIEQLIVTGTRVPDRSATETAVPVDVVSGDTLSNVGVTEINQALSVMLPSFNFPRPGLADGTDTIRPASLRGLSPDHTLVLMNSKRRHASSLVNVNGTIGRGAAAVDLNTIPAAIVQSIEVLRDGASAQYGSDAIAGVINVRLKQDSDGGDVLVAYGARDFDYDTPVAAAPAGATWPAPSSIGSSGTDGETLTASAWKGFGFGDTGYLTIAGEYKDQERTERGGYDFRQQYPLVGTAFDPREAAFNRFNAWYGEPELEQLTFFANGGGELDGGVAIYGWASYQDRESRSAGFFRRALDDRNVIQIYPDGYLPIITPEVTDYSAAAGATWEAAEWTLDTSLDLRQERDAVRCRELAESLDGHDEPHDSSTRAASTTTSSCSTSRRCARTTSARLPRRSTSRPASKRAKKRIRSSPASRARTSTAACCCRTARRPHRARRSSRASVRRTRPMRIVRLSAPMSTSRRISRRSSWAPSPLRAEDYSDFGNNVSGKVAGALRLH